MRFNYKNKVLAQNKNARKVARQKRIDEINKNKGSDDDEVVDNKTNVDLTKAKRQQIFKKGRAMAIKAQIAELKLQSKKLKKKDMDQKTEKKKVIKMIKELKALVKRSGEG